MPPTAAPAASPIPPGTGGATREAQLEERVRQLEALIRSMPDPERVRRLEAALQQMPTPGYVRHLESTVQDLSNQVRQLSSRLETSGAGRIGSAPGPGGTGARARAGGATGTGAGEEVAGGSAGLSPAAPPPSPRFEMPEPIPDIPLRARFGPGFEFKTADDEFNLQFHDLTQLDGRFYQQKRQSDYP
jgi:hypothetical protein